MKKIIISLLLILFSVTLYSQTPKYVGVITEVKDSVFIINHDDINIINKTFYIKNHLDSINVLNNEIICDLNSEIEIKNKIIYNNEIVMHNDSIVKRRLNDLLVDNNCNIDKSENKIRKEKNKKRFWRGTTGALLLSLLLL